VARLPGYFFVIARVKEEAQRLKNMPAIKTRPTPTRKIKKEDSA
jgi:hypothetical protein